MYRFLRLRATGSSGYQRFFRVATSWRAVAISTNWAIVLIFLAVPWAAAAILSLELPIPAP